jgi:hypothetical protein
MFSVRSVLGFYKLHPEAKEERKKKTQQHRWTNVGVRGFNARLLARSQFASGRSCDWPTRTRFSVDLLGPTANAQLVPKFHIALHASHAALSMVTLNISPYSNVTSTLTSGWIALVMGDMGEGALHREERK